MVLKDEEINKLIADYEKKSDEAYRNYQDTGYSRYWATHRKYEDLADTLKVARDGKKKHYLCSVLESDVKQWAGTISQMPYYSRERKEKETTDILNAIVYRAKWI